jgi:hypothetical protein
MSIFGESLLIEAPLELAQFANHRSHGGPKLAIGLHWAQQ